jgi:hypothetical protein
MINIDLLRLGEAPTNYHRLGSIDYHTRGCEKKI